VDATVACRQLGFVRAVSYSFGERRAGESFSFGGIACAGHEESLSECWFETSGACSGGRVELTCASEAIGVGAVELGGVHLVTDGGFLLAKVGNGSFGPVCDSEFDGIDAMVACRHLGMARATIFKTGQSSPFLEMAFTMSGVGCIGVEDSLGACQYFGGGSCDGERLIQVSCGEAVSVGALLSDGDFEASVGGGPSRPVCGDGFDPVDATVACRQLGFVRAVSYSFGERRAGESFSFGGIACAGHEESLSECWFETSGACSGGRVELTCASEAIGVGAVELGGVHLVTDGGFLLAKVAGVEGVTFGPVCGRGFESSDAMVACRHLQMAGVHNFSVYESVFFAPSEFSIQNVGCSGNESDMGACHLTTTFGCSSRLVVRLACLPKLDLMLENKQEPRIFVASSDGQFGSLCSDRMSRAAAQVMCRHLQASQDRGIFVQPLESDPEFSVSDVHCQGTEVNISDCSWRLTGGCDIGIVRWADWCDDGVPDFNWTSSVSSHVGVAVQVQQGSLAVQTEEAWWGPVCLDGFGDSEAARVCESFNFPRFDVYEKSSHSTNLAATTVDCKSGAVLSECTFVSDHSCLSQKLVGLFCYAKEDEQIVVELEQGFSFQSSGGYEQVLQALIEALLGIFEMSNVHDGHRRLAVSLFHGGEARRLTSLWVAEYKLFADTGVPSTLLTRLMSFNEETFALSLVPHFEDAGVEGGVLVVQLDPLETKKILVSDMVTTSSTSISPQQEDTTGAPATRVAHVFLLVVIASLLRL